MERGTKYKEDGNMTGSQYDSGAVSIMSVVNVTESLFFTSQILFLMLIF